MKGRNGKKTERIGNGRQHGSEPGGRGGAGEGRMEKDSGSAGTVWQKEMPGEGSKAWK